MRWEGYVWTGCSIGGGEEIKGYEDGGPPTLCQPASQQEGGEEVNNLAGGAWRGLEECWGIWGKFLVSHFIFIQDVYFHSLGSSGVVGPAWTSFWLTQWNERRQNG